MSSLVGKLLHCQRCGDRITNSFALVIGESQHYVHIKYLPQIRTYEDHLRYRGKAVPDVSRLEEYEALQKHEYKRAKKWIKDDGSLDYISFGDDAFLIWDGEPKGFNHLD